MPLSNKYFMRHVCGVYGLIFIGFGINCMVRPESALGFFDLAYPVVPSQQRLIDTLMVVYGYRDIFIGLALIAAAYWGTIKSLGLTTLATGSVAAVDGWVCYSMVGSGASNHWNYTPLLLVVGTILTLGY